MSESADLIRFKNNAGHLSIQEINKRNSIRNIEWNGFSGCDIKLNSKGLEKLSELQKIYIIPDGIERSLVFLYCYSNQELDRLNRFFETNKRMIETSTGYIVPHPEYKRLQSLLKETQNTLMKLQKMLIRKEIKETLLEEEILREEAEETNFSMLQEMV